MTSTLERAVPHAATRPSSGLPVPPDDDELVRYVDPRRGWVQLAQLGSLVGLVWSLTHFAALSVWVLLLLLPAFGALGWSTLSILLGLGCKPFGWDGHLGRVAAWAPATVPSVDVYIPTCGEELAVLENTFRHCAGLDWPGELAVWVLDDAGRPEVEAAARRYGLGYLARPERGYMKKAGNLRYAFARTQGEYIAIFDADFCPRPDFLLHTAPYLDDPTVGIVQTPQYFDVAADQGWLQRGAGAVQEYFYRWVQPVRDRWRGAICVGSCGLYRRTALAPMGGTALIEHSEDVHTGFDLLSAGYRVRYLPVVLAKGLCPDELGAFINQQYRWCAGSMSLLTSRKFWTAPVGIMPRLCFATGFGYYIFTGIMSVLLPLPALVMVWVYPERLVWQSWIPLLPSIITSYLILPAWHRAAYGSAGFRTKVVYGWAHQWALRDRLRGSLAEWKPTGGRGSGRDRELRYRRSVLTVTGTWLAVMLAGIVCRHPGRTPVDLVPVLFFTVSQSVLALATLWPADRPVDGSWAPWQRFTARAAGVWQWQLGLGGLLAGIGVVGVLQARRPSFWLDEATSTTIAAQPWHQLADQLLTGLPHMGPYYLALWGWVRLGLTSDLSVRLLSVLGGLVAVGLLYSLARRWWGPVWGLVAAGLLGVNPMFLRYLTEARAYSWTLAAVVGATLALDGVLRAPSWRRALGYGALVGVMLALSPATVGVLVAHALVALVVARPSWQLLGWAGFATAGMLATAMPAFAGIAGVGGSATGWVAPITGPRLAHELGVLAGGALWAPAAYLAVVGALALYAAGRDQRVLVSALGAVVPPAVLAGLSLVAPLYLSRYLIGTLPFLVLCAVALLHGVPWRSARTGLTVGLVGLAAVGLLLGDPLVGPQRSEEFRPIAQYLAAHHAGEPVVSLPGWAHKGVARYWPAELQFGAVRADGNRIPHWTPEAVMRRIDGAPTVWVVERRADTLTGDERRLANAVAWRWPRVLEVVEAPGLVLLRRGRLTVTPTPSR